MNYLDQGMKFHLILRSFRNFGSIAIVTGALIFSSCMKKESFSDIPVIAYKSFNLTFNHANIADTGYLTISFQDGDGDIGLRPDDTLSIFHYDSAYYYNYIIDYYEKINGQFVKRVFDSTMPTFNARIPYLTPDDPTKAIKGIIVNTMQMNPIPVYDTVKFKFYIYDRALHKSNVDSTPPIILRRR